MIPESTQISYQRVGGAFQLAEIFVVHSGIQPDYDIRAGFIELKRTGELIIYDGFVWDGGSGPAYNNKSMIAGSLPHDALYKLFRLGLLPLKYRYLADRLLIKTGDRAGMLKTRQAWVLFAVKTFARRSALPNNRRVTECIYLNRGNLTQE